MKTKRTTFFFFTVFVASLLLAACNVEEMGSLPELSKPYVGLYECTALTLSGKDMKEEFDDIRLELFADGRFELRFRGKHNQEGSYAGEYEADIERGEIGFSAKRGARTASAVFPMEKGKILVRYNLGGRLLYAEFQQP